MRAPVVGVCAVRERVRWGAGPAGTWEQDVAMVARSYLDRLHEAGAVSVLLVPDERAAADPGAVLSRVDGLLLAGGADIEPAAYGAAREALCETADPARDGFELALARYALAADLPVFGICRGLQLLNVAAGGSLHQDLVADGFADHRPMPGRLDGATLHAVDVVAGTHAARLAGAGRQRVNSHHHQGVHRLGHGAVVTARSVPDGVVEALEWPDHRYAVGVQWHPEDPSVGHALDAFVTAAGRCAATLALKRSID